MDRKRVVIAEICPTCGSLDVTAVEPRWFDIELDRRDWLESPLVVEFGCRSCGTRWE
ncbi:hypothetical protein [Microbacterium sp. C7(2022)]|uniref:hypothetical protein n=1 Tax=Microbacterium sp. C7(2022) TaxID=2992759 RepID=UPI00237C2DDC|nr:hypothetical protein [Microbacterium sp. C7(2022)]MDE0545799.1 hypothetical protein [Microbacterium sp. C7(2022)]